MYTRSYPTQDEKISVPENYVGNAFEKREPEPMESSGDTKECISEPALASGGLGSLFKKIPVPAFLSGLNVFRGGLDGFGTEEILIIGVALFLLFSKSGDKECAIMLLLLLFIK